jgi:hypothetical protein
MNLRYAAARRAAARPRARAAQLLAFAPRAMLNEACCRPDPDRTKVDLRTSQDTPFSLRFDT